VARGEFYPLRWSELRVRVVHRWHGTMYRLEHSFIMLRPRDREHAGMRGSDLFGLRSHAAGHDHFAIFRHRCADCGKRFRLRAVEKTAGIHDRQVGTGMFVGKFVTLGTQAGNDALGINQGFWATERDKRDARRAVHCGPVIDGIGARWRSLAETEIRGWPLFRHEKDGPALQFTSLERHFLRRKLRISRSHSTSRERVADPSLSIAG